MAWSAPSGCTRSPQRELNNTLGLASSGRAVICPELLNGGNKKRSHQVIVKDEFEEDNYSDELSPPSEKKRRLTTDQVNFLEMSFNMDLKLEPERKALLAKELGISPRQVAIWFQNRRARWKNKQLEQDFESLKANFEAVMKEKENILLERDSVSEENKRLQAEVLRLQDLLERMRNSRPIDTMGTGSEGKSGLTSPTKSSEDQGDVQDSGQSCLVGGVEGMESATAWELNVKMDSDHAPIFLSDEFFGPSNFALLLHPLATGGVYFEDGLYSTYDEGHYNGLTRHEYMEL